MKWINEPAKWIKYNFYYALIVVPM